MTNKAEEELSFPPTRILRMQRGEQAGIKNYYKKEEIKSSFIISNTHWLECSQWNKIEFIQDDSENYF